MDTKNWTGERLETFIFNENTIEHLHRYAIAQTLAKDKKVLDIACGEGYGSNHIAKFAKEVKGVDISDIDISKAIDKYKKDNLEFVVGSILDIPFGDKTFDMIVSYETLEHLAEHEVILKEVNRVLKPGGLLIISTPNKLNYSDKKSYKNPFHVKELYPEEFKLLVGKYFSNIQMLNQKYLTGSIILSKDCPNHFYNGDYTSLNINQNFEEEYNIIIASNGDLPLITSSIFYSPFHNQHQYDLADSVKSSYSYRLGNLILRPFSLVKRFTKKLLK